MPNMSSREVNCQRSRCFENDLELQRASRPGDLGMDNRGRYSGLGSSECDRQDEGPAEPPGDAAHSVSG